MCCTSKKAKKGRTYPLGARSAPDAYVVVGVGGREELVQEGARLRQASRGVWMGKARAACRAVRRWRAAAACGHA